MLDSERVPAKLDDLEGYLGELRQVAPSNLEEYRRPEKRRACERLLQISIESVIDVCNLLVAGLRLGLPADENDLFEKLEEAGVLSSDTVEVLRRMKGCRNILLHGYARVADEIVFEAITARLHDFRDFAATVRRVLASG